MTHQTKFTYNSKDQKPEYNDGKLMTVQDDALSIRKLMERYSNGIPLQFRQSEFLDVDDIRNINKFYSPALDLTDLDALNEQVHRLRLTQDALEKQINAITPPEDKPAEEA